MTSNLYMQLDGFVRQPDGTLLDRDGMATLEVIVRPTFNGDLAATVLWTGYPVMVIDAGDNYAVVHLTYGGDLDQVGLHFLEALGEIEEGGAARFADDPTISLDEIARGDGHELVRFVGLVAEALHEAYPDETPKPEGW